MSTLTGSDVTPYLEERAAPVRYHLFLVFALEKTNIQRYEHIGTLHSMDNISTRILFFLDASSLTSHTFLTIHHYARYQHLQVASLIKASEVAVAVIELLKEKAKNKDDVKELRETIKNTVSVIQALVAKHGEQGGEYFKDICEEMEGYLAGIGEDLEGTRRKSHGIKGFFNANQLRDTILSYKKRVDDLKTDFLIHITGGNTLALVEMHRMLDEMRNVQETASKEESVVIRITVTHATLFLFFDKEESRKVMVGTITTTRAIRGFQVVKPQTYKPSAFDLVTSSYYHWKRFMNQPCRRVRVLDEVLEPSSSRDYSPEWSNVMGAVTRNESVRNYQTRPLNYTFGLRAEHSASGLFGSTTVQFMRGPTNSNIEVTEEPVSDGAVGDEDGSDSEDEGYDGEEDSDESEDEWTKCARAPPLFALGIGVRDMDDGYDLARRLAPSKPDTDSCVLLGVLIRRHKKLTNLNIRATPVWLKAFGYELYMVTSWDNGFEDAPAQRDMMNATLREIN
ncbi:hypothetical protein EDD18DRAFT_1334603 [Armillaria luteobubalina]|uniref:Uncharacterized protein n=1 Tax=Armillaria luteobubalina TaxID=153913 RepID=A0AA39PWB7_9AGAR|nr:hypothetical protein EDD18DRAFT_1334603 [Armillaria luteobubalina]